MASMDGTMLTWPMWDKAKHAPCGTARELDDHDDGLLYLGLVKEVFRKYAKAVDAHGDKVMTAPMWRAALKAVDCTDPMTVEVCSVP